MHASTGPAARRARRAGARRGRRVRAHSRAARCCGNVELDAARPRLGHRARLRHGAHAPGRRPPARAGVDPPARRARTAGCARRCGSARTSCSSAIPPHAAVGETVESRRRTRARVRERRAARAARTGPPWPLPDGDDVSSLGMRTSHPDWIVRRARGRVRRRRRGRDPRARRRTAAGDAARQPMRATPEGLAAELRACRRRGARRARSTRTRCSCAIPVISRGCPRSRDGRATPQDQASQAVVAVLDPQPGERVLDVASAPGRQGDRRCRAHERPRRRGRGRPASRPGAHRDARRDTPRARRRDRCRWSPTARHPAVRGRRLRPRAARRAVQWPRCAAPAARRALAHRSRRHRRPRGAAARRCSPRPPRRSSPAAGSCTSVVHVDATTRPSASTSGPSASFPTSRAVDPPGPPWRPARARRAAAALRRAHRRHVRPRARAHDGDRGMLGSLAADEDRAVDPRRRLREPRGRRRTGRRRRRPAPRRLHGRPLRAEPDDRAAGREGVAQAHRPLPRLPPHGRQTRVLLARVRRRGRRRLHRSTSSSATRARCFDEIRSSGMRVGLVVRTGDAVRRGRAVPRARSTCCS